MGGVSNVASSIQAVNEMMMQANLDAMKAADKMMRYNVAVSVGQETGKGEQIDLTA